MFSQIYDLKPVKTGIYTREEHAMPYCPKCDMEFIDGITVCSDCGGTLVESKEAAEAMKKQMEEEESNTAKTADISSDLKGKRPPSFTHVYVRKSQQYDDLKSSASAFFITGGCLTIFAVLCWLNIINLPLNTISRVVITVFGVGSLGIAAKTIRDAKNVRGQINEEENRTLQLVNWFTDNHTGTQLDEQLLSEYGELIPEELTLKRFDLIQDILITNNDLSDPSYIDLLAEEIYGKLYQE